MTAAQKSRVDFFTAIRKRNRPEETARYFEKERTCKNTLCCNLKLSKRRSSTFMASKGCISLRHSLARAKKRLYIYFSAESAGTQAVKINRHSFRRVKITTRIKNAENGLVSCTNKTIVWKSLSYVNLTAVLCKYSFAKLQRHRRLRCTGAKRIGRETKGDIQFARGRLVQEEHN